MSKALKPVSATKTAETQLEDLMQALPVNRLEDLSLQTQAVDMADKAAPATEAEIEAKVEKSQKRDARSETRPRAQAGEEPCVSATQAPRIEFSLLSETDETFSEYSKLFIFERHNTQFGVPVKYVVEVVRDFAPIEPLTLNLRSCIGTVVYRNCLLPVFECGDLTPATSQNQPATAPQSIVKLDVNGTLLCLSMDRHVAVLSSADDILDPSNRILTEAARAFFILDVIGYQSSNLTLISPQRLAQEVVVKIGSQTVIEGQEDITQGRHAKTLGTTSEFIHARISNVHFVVPVENVVEIIEGYEVTPIYGNGNFLRGLINLRGQVLSCLDISKDLSLMPRALDERNKYMVLQENGKDLVLCVDDVLGMMTVDRHSFRNSTEILSEPVSDLFQGISEIGELTIMRLSLPDLIRSENLNEYREKRNFI